MHRYLGPSLAQIALSLAPGEVSQPVGSADSFYLIRLDDVAAAQVPDFRQVIPEVEAEYLSRGREAALENKLAELWQAADIQFNSSVTAGLAVTEQRPASVLRSAAAGVDKVREPQ